MTTEGRDIVSVIKEQIEHFGAGVTMVDVGTVVEVGDGVARIHGLHASKYNELLELDRYVLADYITFYNLATVHAFKGEKEKAYEYLRLMNQRPKMPKWMIKDLNNDPLFNSIRDELEFQRIVSDVEAKYLAEDERVKQWLEENELL